METPQPISLEQKLTELHSSRIIEAEKTIEVSRQVLGHVAMVYGNQLHLDFEGATR